jgi:tungstate transport system ATP-binding protein
VALAARLVLRPKVLLMDEPTASVDAASAQMIRDAALRARQAWGTTLVIASHDWQWLYEICDEVRHLFRGRFFGADEENFVFGPWIPDDDDFFVKPLSDGQVFCVPRPPSAKSAAILPSKAIRILHTASDASPARGILHGVISRLVHEKHTGRIVVTALFGNLPITIKVTRDDLRQLGLYPGLAITIHYDPRCIKWSDIGEKKPHI